MTAPALSTVELLLEWDQRRPRSQQREIGMSEFGGCQRRAGYQLTGTPPTDPKGSIQAVLGTAIHHVVGDVLQQLQTEGVIPAEDLIEAEVHYAGVKGHLDRYEHHHQRVIDVKTRLARQVGLVKLHGPYKAEIWQVHLYGAGLITQGIPVASVAIDYLARDTGEEYRWEGPFDPEAVRDALAWLDMVRVVPVEELRRDHAPDSAFCRGCQFRRACWGETPEGRDPRVILLKEDPDVAKWAQRLQDAQAAKRDAEAAIEEAKGALDGARPSDDTPLDFGAPFLLRWKKTRTKRVNLDAVRADYATAGEPVPVKWSHGTQLEFVAREPDDQPMVELDGGGSGA